MWIPIGAVPFLLDVPGAPAVGLVIATLAVRGLFGPVWVIASTSWLRDLVPRQVLGSYHGRRLAAMTSAMAIVGLGGSFFVQWWESVSSPDNEVLAYSFLLFGGTLVLGPVGLWAVSRAREPLMASAVQSCQGALAILAEPLRDRNFSQLVRFLFLWSLTSNLAIPFFAVFMLTRLGLSLPAVIGLTVLSQLANVVFLKVWGPLADRVGSKTVLSLSASLFLLVILGWTFTTHLDRYFLTVPLLVILHIFVGIATAGVTLTVRTLALKVAPKPAGRPMWGPPA